MNIFVLDEDPVLANQYACDKHCVKMVLESCQILSTAAQLNKLPADNLYKATHAKHPSVLWAATSWANFEWLLNFTIQQFNEYTYRYGKQHKSYKIIQHILDNLDYFKSHFNNDLPLSVPPRAMPDQYKVFSTNKSWADVVQSYRNYYVGDKSKFAKWKARPIPDWYKEMINERGTVQALD